MKVSVKIEGGRATGKTRAFKAMTDGMSSGGFSVSGLSESGECEFGVEEYFFTAHQSDHVSTARLTVLTKEGVYQPFPEGCNFTLSEDLGWVEVKNVSGRTIAYFASSEIVSAVYSDQGEAK